MRDGSLEPRRGVHAAVRPLHVLATLLLAHAPLARARSLPSPALVEAVRSESSHRSMEQQMQQMPLEPFLVDALRGRAGSLHWDAPARATDGQCSVETRYRIIVREEL